MEELAEFCPTVVLAVASLDISSPDGSARFVGVCVASRIVLMLLLLLFVSELLLSPDPEDPALDRLRRKAAVLDIICRVEEVSVVDDDVAPAAAEDVFALLLLPCFNTIILCTPFRLLFFSMQINRSIEK
jgi:hypothetical protein